MKLLEKIPGMSVSDQEEIAMESGINREMEEGDQTVLQIWNAISLWKEVLGDGRKFDTGSILS